MQGPISEADLHSACQAAEPQIPRVEFNLALLPCHEFLLPYQVVYDIQHPKVVYRQNMNI